MVLAPADILLIHELLMTSFGGMRGITESGFGRLEGAAAAPSASAFGMEIFPSAREKAGALCYAIMKAHPFSDGNKRVALVALDVALDAAGLRLQASNPEAYSAIMALADGSMSREGLLDWLERHSTER